jgi:hypothetical protein
VPAESLPVGMPHCARAAGVTGAQPGAGGLKVFRCVVNTRTIASQDRSPELPVPAPSSGFSALEVLALQAAVVSHPRLGPAATAFASELATRLGCERVAVGFVEDRFSRVVALSHGALGDGSTDTLRAMGAAMDEAIEQAATVIAPRRPSCRRGSSCPTRSSSARRRGGVHDPDRGSA